MQFCRKSTNLAMLIRPVVIRTTSFSVGPLFKKIKLFLTNSFPAPSHTKSGNAIFCHHAFFARPKCDKKRPLNSSGLSAGSSGFWGIHAFSLWLLRPVFPSLCDGIDQAIR